MAGFSHGVWHVIAFVPKRQKLLTLTSNVGAAQSAVDTPLM